MGLSESVRRIGVEPEEIVAPKKLWDDKVAKSQPANHTVIEFMALYTADMANNRSGDPSAYINTLEASVTAAMSGSSVTGAAKVIRYAESTFDETAPFSYNDFNLEIYNMTNNQGDYSNMYNERTSYRGDLAVLLIDGNAVADDSPDYAICGLAGKTSAYDASVAFAVVSDGCASGDLTFAHEFSHLLGGRHDWGAFPLDSTPGWTPGTAHGYTNTSVDFRTVMGSKASCAYVGGCARLSRYSDPDQTATIGGTPYALGVADDLPGTAGNQRTDMVDVLANSIPDVAQYRTVGDSTPGQPSSMTVDRLCSGVNELSWPAASGTVGWYEVESAGNSSYTSPVEEYNGGQQSLFLNVGSTKWVRVRSCNAEGCSSWRNGNQTATTTCP